MAKPPAEDRETFLRRREAADLIAVLLELAEDHDAVQARIARTQLADRPADAPARLQDPWSHVDDSLVTSDPVFFPGFAPAAAAVGWYDRRMPLLNPIPTATP